VHRTVTTGTYCINSIQQLIFERTYKSKKRKRN
jgi:hypothetical protein